MAVVSTVSADLWWLQFNVLLAAPAFQRGWRALEPPGPVQRAAASTWNSLTMTQSEENLPTGEFSHSQCLFVRSHLSGPQVWGIRANGSTLWGLLERVQLWLYPWRHCTFFFRALISICFKTAYGKRQQNVARGSLFNPLWQASQNSRRSSKQMQIWSFCKNILEPGDRYALAPCSDCCDWAGT